MQEKNFAFLQNIFKDSNAVNLKGWRSAAKFLFILIPTLKKERVNLIMLQLHVMCIIAVGTLQI